MIKTVNGKNGRKRNLKHGIFQRAKNNFNRQNWMEKQNWKEIIF